MLRGCSGLDPQSRVAMLAGTRVLDLTYAAGAIGNKFVAYLALDTPEDAAMANGVLKKLS